VTFRVRLHSAISGRPLQTFVEQAGSGDGTAYVEDEPRVSYLVIESANVEWTAILDEAVAAAAQIR
jgi:Ethanolamine utilization protein EutJ (predicted chaperonin)